MDGSQALDHDEQQDAALVDPVESVVAPAASTPPLRAAIQPKPPVAVDDKTRTIPFTTDGKVAVIDVDVSAFDVANLLLDVPNVTARFAPKGPDTTRITVVSDELTASGNLTLMTR